MPTRKIPELTEAQRNAVWSRIRSLDAIRNAIATVEDHPAPSERVQAETLEELRMLEEKADMEVVHIKREYGFEGY